MRKRAETRDGSKAVGKEPDPGHPTKTDPKTVGKKGPASSSKKKPVKKS
ncbi:unnamed protein product [Allacma fusca]|uniref:Uncharacterized protein n=1 Tax=Allacma fusca TaxID=39272 RepID=A0A8J2P725_9HEXA|nr:unnamed protein product [Allacma fusca]